MVSVFYFLLLWVVPRLDSYYDERYVSKVEQKSSSELTILFGGDMTLAHRFEQYVGSRLEYPFSDWHTIGSYDCMMVNLENPITLTNENIEKPYTFKMHPRYLQLLKQARISVVSCANNHIGDYGRRGIEETMRWLDVAGIASVGVGTVEKVREPYILFKKGKRIGFLAYGSNGIHIATKNNVGTLPVERSTIVQDVKRAKPRVDFLVVSLHWGNENEHYPTEHQRNLARSIIDAGADLIIGHHPHVLQGYEKYKHGLICYSLGNFLFGGNGFCANSETVVLKVTIYGASWDYSFEPVTITQWKPRAADFYTSQRTLNLVAQRSQNLRELCLNNSKGE
ncbi:MAG: CapA family protein [Bacteroidetes bacterium]|nr:CapA family protein [Bacteroidota bacterium]